MWFARTDTDRAWQGLDLQFSKEERALFFASTTMMLGDGRTALFWDDRWINGQSVREIAPMLYQCIPKQRRKTRIVAEGLDRNTWARDIQGTNRDTRDWPVPDVLTRTNVGRRRGWPAAACSTP